MKSRGWEIKFCSNLFDFLSIIPINKRHENGIYGDTDFWAVEVKNTPRVRPEDLGGLRSFAADYPECEPLLLYRGRERLKIERIHCLPVDEFLRDLTPLKQSIVSG